MALVVITCSSHYSPSYHYILLNTAASYHTTPYFPLSIPPTVPDDPFPIDLVHAATHHRTPKVNLATIELLPLPSEELLSDTPFQLVSFDVRR
jgi:hypothetical protein